MQWEQAKKCFLQCKTCPFPPFLGLSLQMQRLDDIDRDAWQCIERKEVAWVKT